MGYELEKYCTDTFVEIPKDDWLEIVKEARKDEEKKQELSSHLAELVSRYPVPCPPVTEKRRYNDFYNFLEFVDEEVVSQGPFRSQFDHPVSDTTWKWSRRGCRFCNSFFLWNRINTAHRSNPSLVEAWSNPVRRTSIMRAAINLKKHLNMVTAYEAASMKINVASNFRPTAARQIYNHLGNKGTVLDFSAGFGGRYLGFYGSDCQHYIGIDPNKELIKPYNEMFDWIDQERPGKTREMVWQPAEEVDYKDWHGKVDLVFTSPPYFNLERYSQDDSQSWKRYPKAEDWINNFLFVVIDKVLPCLKSNGTIAINIADSVTYKDVQLLERLYQFLSEKGLTPRPALKYLLSWKPGDNNKKKNVGMGKLAEPILVFSR